ncbi:MAG: hypothetical protein Q7T41_01995, partial [Candidatus Saccharibacteria bacterium]|nr:hypothetical protein [Candidatus Saccharibacteria bacterium]
SCLLPGTCEFAKNEEARAQVAIELAAEKINLEKTYKRIKQEAPEARIYVIGYPQFVQASPETCASNVHLDNDEATFINFDTGYFNVVIIAAADSAGVVYVDVEDILVNVNLCSGSNDDQMTVNGVTAGNDIAISTVDSGLLRFGLCVVRNCIGSETFHPNQMGHQKYKTAVLSLTDNLTVVNPDPIQTSVPIPNDYFGITAKGFVNSLNSVPYSPQKYAQMQEMITGAIDYREPIINLNGLMPNSAVSFEIHSTPVDLGTLTVGADGSITANLQIPQNIDPGYHEIHVYGFDSFGQPINYYQSIILGESELDFDGDQILNEDDSCPAVINSFIDSDEDGVDDACDPTPRIAQQVDETPTDGTPLEEEPQDNDLAEFVDKGLPSPETVAENEQMAQSTGVLGASTTSQVAANATLQSTGKNATISILIGLTSTVSAIFIGLIAKKD